MSKAIGKTVSIPTEAYEAMMGLMAIHEQREQERQDRAAKIEATKPKPPMSFLTDQDVYEVVGRIDRVIHSLKSIHELAEDSMQYCKRESYPIAIMEMAKANILGLDACLDRLTEGVTSAEFD